MDFSALAPSCFIKLHKITGMTWIWFRVHFHGSTVVLKDLERSMVVGDGLVWVFQKVQSVGIFLLKHVWGFRREWHEKEEISFCKIWMAGSEFGVNNMIAWIHPALYWLRLEEVQGGIFSWHTLALFLPTELCLNATAYPLIVTDYVHPFISQCNHPFYG